MLLMALLDAFLKTYTLHRLAPAAAEVLACGEAAAAGGLPSGASSSAYHHGRLGLGLEAAGP